VFRDRIMNLSGKHHRIYSRSVLIGQKIQITDKE
jgi:hypothetical protein